MTAPVFGAILAAGEGSRLRSDGWDGPKPLVRVAGVPLIEHAISNFLASGVTRLAIIFSDSEEDCAAFVRSRFPGAEIDILLRRTSSSFESFRALSARIPAGRILFSTVDGWWLPEDFAGFVRAAVATPADSTVLAVTRFVDDERPLWVRTRGDGAVEALGGEGGDCVTAGAYLFSARARELAADAPADRLREFLHWLVRQEEPVRAVSVGKVVDVDRGRDVAVAEELARRRSASAETSS
ncbi:MAG: NDP-sugar synthase [Acidobacteria bacterium]|nr:NDP-sugar synthase [Acidobacteriota bacterium]MCA1609917.1 NDP-sugar synthase [Acidobacteriota bacterium]